MTDLEYDILNGASRKKRVAMGDGTVAERVGAIIEDGELPGGDSGALPPGSDRSGSILDG